MSNPVVAKARAPLCLVPTLVRPHKQMIEVLEILLEGARCGDITGIAFACSMRGGPESFITEIAGDCYDRPSKARGMVSLLADQIAGLQHRMRAAER